MDTGGRVLWRVWCVHCGAWHDHGLGDGHRIAHCTDTTCSLHAVRLGRCPEKSQKATGVGTSRREIDASVSAGSVVPLAALSI